MEDNEEAETYTYALAVTFVYTSTLSSYKIRVVCCRHRSNFEISSQLNLDIVKFLSV